MLTARFQSDTIERRYGQYRQMSRGRFLVSLKDVNCFEKILKIKDLMKEGIDMSQNLQHVDVTTDIEEFMLSVDSYITDSIYTIKLLIIREKSQISSLNSLFISQNVSLRIAVNIYQSAQKIIRIKHIYMNCHE